MSVKVAWGDLSLIKRGVVAGSRPVLGNAFLISAHISNIIFHFIID